MQPETSKRLSVKLTALETTIALACAALALSLGGASVSESADSFKPGWSY